MAHFEQFTHLTFDCYGTLIDWETGILNAVTPVVARHGIAAEPERLLQLYIKYEAEQEARPYALYYDVLRGVMAGIATELGFVPTPADGLTSLGRSLAPFCRYSRSAQTSTDTLQTGDHFEYR
jgi:2-haloacid dehalogenase